jgi:leucyl aminopeptidase
MFLKEFIRNTLNFLHLDLTKNLEYDRLTKVIMRSGGGGYMQPPIALT